MGKIVLKGDYNSLNYATMRSEEVDEKLRANRSMPGSVVIPVLGYPDVGEAVSWLCEAFGFVERLRIGEHRAQLRFGSGDVVVAELRESPGSPAGESEPQNGSRHSVMVRVADADKHCEQSKWAGARIVSPPTDYPYGERQYTVEDIGGHVWTFSQTIADADPEKWGGTLVEQD